jgi:hypothetical protein
MKSDTMFPFLSLIVVAALLAMTTMTVVDAFAPPQPSMARTRIESSAKFAFLPEPEREKLTRDSEPEDFFAT